MATQRKPTGWKYDRANDRLQAMFNGTEVFDIDADDLTISQNVVLPQVSVSGRGTVTQQTNHSTGVTVNATSGTITLASADLAAGAEAEFTVTNSKVAANDVVVVCVADNNDASGTPLASVSDVSAGSFKILLTNLHATTAAFNDASTLNFVVIKSTA